MNRDLRQYELFRNIPKRGFQIITLLFILLLVSYGKLEQQENDAKFEQAKEELSIRDSLIEKLKIEGQKNSTEIEALKLVLLDEKSKREQFEGQINAIGATVGTLDKLSKTDEELLQKYSKVYFLNEHYVPVQLTYIDSQYVSNKNNEYKIHANVWPFLKNLLDSARSEGLSLEIVSAYRDFYTQSALKSNYKITYGAGTANKFSADQGYSEHQLGTTVDFGTSSSSGVLVGFEKTPEYTWLINNASRFGFTLSYPENNSYYIFEPWHFRFVGRALAQNIKSEGGNFYDLDQRIINNYLANIFD